MRMVKHVLNNEGGALDPPPGDNNPAPVSEKQLWMLRFIPKICMSLLAVFSLALVAGGSVAIFTSRDTCTYAARPGHATLLAS